MDTSEPPHPVLESDWIGELVAMWPIQRISPSCDHDLVVTRHRPHGAGDPGYHVRRGSSPSVVEVETIDDVADLVLDWRRARGRLRRVPRSAVRTPFEVDKPQALALLVNGLSSVTLDVSGFLVTVEAVEGDLARVVATAPAGIAPPAGVDAALEVLGRWDASHGGLFADTSARVVPGHGVLFDRWIEAHDLDADIVGEVMAVAQDRRVFGRAVELTKWPRWARPTLRRDLFPGVPAEWWHSRVVEELPGSEQLVCSTPPSISDDASDHDDVSPQRRWRPARTAGSATSPPVRSAGTATLGFSTPSAAEVAAISTDSPPDEPPSLGLHSWAWRVARTELERLVAEPERQGAMSAVEVIEQASSLLAAGPSTLAGLGEVLLAAPPGDANAIRKFVRSVTAPGGPEPEGMEVPQ